jgi:hypothetical protein
MCDHSSHNRVLVDGDRQPNGWQFPRCADCGHRTPYNGSKPTPTRRILRRHPFYLFTEFASRREARKMANNMIGGK